MSDRTKLKKLGVIGGLGPAATAHFFQRIVDLTDAATDQEHLDITIINIPQTPDRTAFILGKSDESFVPIVRDAALKLEEWGCDYVCITCVTAHSMFDELFGDLTHAQALHMPRAAAQEIVRAHRHKVGIMATDGTARTKVLQQAMQDAGLETCLPDAYHQKLVMSLIYDDVKMGKKPDMAKFADVCGYLRMQGCDSVVLGCTELSLIDTPSDYAGMLVVDAMEVLAKTAVQACGAKLRIN